MVARSGFRPSRAGIDAFDPREMRCHHFASGHLLATDALGEVERREVTGFIAGDVRYRCCVFAPLVRPGFTK